MANAPTKPEPPPTQVNIHGIPPKPNMAEAPPIEGEKVSDTTRAEMEAGRKTLSAYRSRAQDEQDYGKKLVTPEGKEEP